MSFRTDRNNNPTAFTTDIAVEGGLVQDTDFVQGDPFSDGAHTYYTAKLLGDPLALTLKVIDKIGFRVGSNPYESRWTYINLPYDLWKSLTLAQKTLVICDMYGCEGGTEMKHLFNV
jgi:hypothetical protein